MARTNGGFYRKLCCRKINGKHCHCFAKEVVVDGERFLNIHYRIDGKEPAKANRYTDEMLEIAEDYVDLMRSRGQKIRLWSY